MNTSAKNGADAKPTKGRNFGTNRQTQMGNIMTHKNSHTLIVRDDHIVSLVYVNPNSTLIINYKDGRVEAIPNFPWSEYNDLALYVKTYKALSEEVVDQDFYNWRIESAMLDEEGNLDISQWVQEVLEYEKNLKVVEVRHADPKSAFVWQGWEYPKATPLHETMTNIHFDKLMDYLDDTYNEVARKAAIKQFAKLVVSAATGNPVVRPSFNEMLELMDNGVI